MIELDWLNYLLGKYISFGFNSPKKYPTEPFLKNAFTPKKQVMTSSEMERIMKRNFLKLGAKPTDGKD